MNLAALGARANRPRDWSRGRAEGPRRLGLSRIVFPLCLCLLTIVAVAFPSARPAAQDRNEPTQVLRVSIVDRTATGDEVEVSGGAEVLRVTQGDAVEIHWASDETTTLHLHGYDVEIDVPTTGEAVMSFAARATGRFPVESHGFGDDHHAEKTLLYVEVLPR